MKPIASLPLGLPFGISAMVWAIIGLIRYLHEKSGIQKRKEIKQNEIFNISDVAVIVPAHNEEVVIKSAIQTLKQNFNKKQIYVVSDGSSDRTYQKALKEGCHVSGLIPGRGKAKALVYLLKKYKLLDNYKLILIVDADTRLDKSFIDKALKIIEDPEISVVFASSRIIWPNHFIPKLSYYFIGYRERLNRIIQYFYMYGQTWKYTNASYVIPGFATLFKSKVLGQIEIDAPGMLIEDFNYAFQLYKKKLGKMSYDPSLVGWDQYPDNLMDYWKQVRRWNIGFFQTIRKNGIWPSFFWLSLGIFSIEVILHSLFILTLPFVILFLILPEFSSTTSVLNNLYNVFKSFNFLGDYTLTDVYIGVFLIDYIITMIIAWTHSKPQLVLYGLFFFIMHYVTSLILVTSIIPGLLGSSDGIWVSPKRQKE